jgi:eukaryotic-like serine/threonine-protein kinase
MTLLKDGEIIRETYEVERFLGEGAFAEVYRVKHRFLGRQAMKVFKSDGMTTQEIERMLGEAILLSRIGHPNIVRVFDANVTEPSRRVYGFFTMEYVAGGTLDQFWRSHGDQFVPVEIAVEIMRQVCRGLAVAHGEAPPIVHRDIKPQNILVGYDGAGLRARVSDFGLAKHVNPLTLLASARGTRSFKAPEAFSDFSNDSCAGDVWALGSTLYLLLTDRLPFPNLGDIAVNNSKAFDRPIIPASHLNIAVDRKLDEILFQALALRSADRYRDAGSMLEALNLWKPSRYEPKADSKSHAPIEMSKSLLGAETPLNEQKAQAMAAQAIRLSRETGKLNEAADRMEEAFNCWPDLRNQHEYEVKLWRRGILM